MTIPSTPRRAGPYIGTGALVTYPFSFKVFGKTDVAVTLADTSGNETLLVLDSSLLVTVNPDQTALPGGTVQYAVAGVAAALPVGYSITILTAVEYKQATQLPTGGNYRAEIVENALDSLAVQIQQQGEVLARALVFSATDATGSTLPPAANRADRLLGFDSTGRAVAVAPASGSAAALAVDLANATSTTKGDALVGVKLNATGAVSRTQDSKNAEQITAADFGILPGASAAVNTVGWKALAAYAKTLGGNIRVQVAPGSYTLDGTALGAYNAAEGSSIDFFGLSNITIEGYGATFTCTNKLGQVWFRFRSCTGITIAGLKLVGAQTGTGGASSSGVPIYFDTAAQDIVIRDIRGNYGYSCVEFQTDDLVPMGGVKYKNVTIRGVKLFGYHHAMELLHIDGLFIDDVSLQGTGSGDNINFRGLYLLNLSNANINGVRSFGCGNPGVGGYPIFLREYTKGGSATLANYNCDNVNFSNLELIGCFCGGLEMNVASGQISNVNVANLTISADNSNAYGGGLLEIAHDTAAPTGVNNVKFTNVQITCGTTAGGATGLLYRNSSNTTTENTAFSHHQFMNVQIDGNACAPINTGSGGWIQDLTIQNLRTSTTDLTPYITLNRVRDVFIDRYFMSGKIDLSGGRLVRVEFDHTTLGTVVLNPVDMAPVIVNGESLTAATITVNAAGSDDAVGSAASPVATLAEACRRVSKLNRGQVAVTISLQVNATYSAFSLSGVMNQINLRSPLGATVPSITITNCARVDIRNGLNCAGGVAIANSSAYLESLTLAGATNGINSVNSRITSNANNFTGTTVGIKALGQSQVWSTGDTGTASTYGYSVGEASVVYKEASSTLTGSSGQKQLVSAAVVNF